MLAALGSERSFVALCMNSRFADKAAGWKCREIAGFAQSRTRRFTAMWQDFSNAAVAEGHFDENSAVEHILRVSLN